MADPTSPPGDHVFDPGDMAALPYQTNIDRRHATRTVPMVVLCLGQSRTGTVSLRQALVKLGYKDCYHYSSVMQENPRDAGLWIEALNAKFKGDGKPYGKDEWDALLGHCQAVTDTPCVLFYKELLAAYPDAKVILTERDDADQWFRSQMSTVVPYAVMALPETWLDRVKQLFSPVDKTPVRLSEVIIKQTPVYKALWHDLRHGTSTAKQVYEDYNAEIKRIVPQENLLVFNVKEGWEPLCSFLGHDVPDEAFPRRNDRAAFEKNQQKFGAFVQAASSRNMMVVGAGMAVLVGVVAFAAMRRG